MTCCCDNPPSCFSQGVRRARKEHRCCECYGPILWGERYEYSSGVWDGGPDNFKTCEPCAAWRNALAKADDTCDCVPFGDLWATIEEWAHEQELELTRVERKFLSPRLADGFPA